MESSCLSERRAAADHHRSTHTTRSIRGIRAHTFDVKLGAIPRVLILTIDADTEDCKSNGSRGCTTAVMRSESRGAAHQLDFMVISTAHAECAISHCTCARLP
jgi:hypothetical protein